MGRLFIGEKIPRGINNVEYTVLIVGFVHLWNENGGMDKFALILHSFRPKHILQTDIKCATKYIMQDSVK